LKFLGKGQDIYGIEQPVFSLVIQNGTVSFLGVF